MCLTEIHVLANKALVTYAKKETVSNNRAHKKNQTRLVWNIGSETKRTKAIYRGETHSALAPFSVKKDVKPVESTNANIFMNLGTAPSSVLNSLILSKPKI